MAFISQLPEFWVVIEIYKNHCDLSKSCDDNRICVWLKLLGSLCYNGNSLKRSLVNVLIES